MLPVLLTVLEWLLYYVILSLKIYVHILTNGAAFLSFMAVATCFAPFYFGPATVWRVLATGFTKIKGALGGRKATGHHQLNADQLVAADVDPAGFDGPESQGAGREKAGQETAHVAISEIVRSLFGNNQQRDRGGTRGSSNDNANGNSSSSKGGSKGKGADKGGASSSGGSCAKATGKGHAAKAAAGPSGGTGGSGGRGGGSGSSCCCKGARAVQSAAPAAAAAAGGGSSASGKGVGTGTRTSGAAGTGADARACASCGKAERKGGGALRKCGSCKAVRYCSQECQAAHWPQHKGQCKRLRQQQEEERKQAAAVS